MGRRLVAMLMALTVIAAACGDDDDDSGADATTTAPAGDATTTTAAAATTTAGDAATTTGADAATTTAGVPVEVRGIEDGVLTIGGITQPVQWVGIDDGVNARIARFKEEGGLPGITEINYLGARDDGSDADRSLAIARELVQQDNVYAVLPITPTVLQPAAGDFFADEKVPYIGSGYAPVFCNNDYGFATQGCSVPGITPSFNGRFLESFALAAGAGDSIEGLKFAISARAEAGGELFGDAYETAITEAGGEVVYYEANVPGGGTADMQPFVDAITDADPDVVVLILDFASTLALKAALVGSGIEAPVFDFAAYVPGLLEAQPTIAAALEQTYVVATTPMTEDDTPYVAQMKADFEAAGLGITGFGSALGYMAADMFIDMLTTVAPNYDRFAEIINEGYEFNPPEGGIPVKYPEFHTDAAACAGLVKVVDAVYEVISSFSCL
jgi:branched-chain amino acid transport system substrate-binding protein